MANKDKRQPQFSMTYDRVRFVVVARMDMPNAGTKVQEGLMKTIQCDLKDE